MADVNLSGRRRQLVQQAGQHFGGDRDLYAVMGYPTEITIEQYFATYLRQDIAGRIVDAYPDATWRKPPELKAEAEFLAVWHDLDKSLQLWRALHRLDRLTNLGHYGVLFLGLDGGEHTATPARGADYSLLYVQPHSERTAAIVAWEDDPRSPRFGLPKRYRITTGVNWTGSGAGQKTIEVHHTRVIHVAEKALEDVSIGTPRLQRGFNRLMDLDKLLGGSAEMYWQNAAMLLAFIADAGADWEPEEKEDMAGQLEDMQNGLRRALRLRGMSVSNVAPGLQGATPGDHVDKQLDMIAGAYGIPKRLLTGNESGELASSQDENSWNGRVAERKEQHASPNIIEPFISTGQQLGFLPAGFGRVHWPEQAALGEKDRAAVALTKAQALQAYLSTPGAELVVSGGTFREWVGEATTLPVVEEDEPLDETDDEVAAQFNVAKRRPA